MKKINKHTFSETQVVEVDFDTLLDEQTMIQQQIDLCQRELYQHEERMAILKAKIVAAEGLCIKSRKVK